MKLLHILERRIPHGSRQMSSHMTPHHIELYMTYTCQFIPHQQRIRHHRQSLLRMLSDMKRQIKAAGRIIYNNRIPVHNKFICTGCNLLFTFRMSVYTLCLIFSLCFLFKPDRPAVNTLQHPFSIHIFNIITDGNL